MNGPSPSLFEQIAQRHVASFAGTYQGSVNAAAIVVASAEPCKQAKDAITAAFRELGYSSTSLGWTVPAPEGDLFTLIEAICPVAVVALDRDAALELSRSFNTPLSLGVETQLLGHACVCFEDFAAMLQDADAKQKAWRLLKTLPRL